MQIDKFEGADFKYDNSYLKILARKYTNKAFLVPNLGIFIFWWNFVIRQIWRCWFQRWEYYFQIPAQELPTKAFSFPNLGIFVFPQNFAKDKFEGADFKYDNYLKILAQKYTNKAFFIQI